MQYPGDLNKFFGYSSVEYDVSVHFESKQVRSYSFILSTSYLIKCNIFERIYKLIVIIICLLFRPIIKSVVPNIR